MASSGNGTSQHLSGELFKMMTGVNLIHVPYRGAPQALTDLVGGQVQVSFDPLPPAIELIRYDNCSPHSRKRPNPQQLMTHGPRFEHAGIYFRTHLRPKY